MLSPFLTNSSSFDEMAELSRPLIGTDRSTPKSADKYVLSMSVVPEKTEHEQLHSLISMGNLGLAFLRCWYWLSTKSLQMRGMQSELLKDIELLIYSNMNVLYLAPWLASPFWQRCTLRAAQ